MKKFIGIVAVLSAALVIFVACNDKEDAQPEFGLLSFEDNLLLSYYIDMGEGRTNIEYTIFNAYTEDSKLQRLLTMADGSQLIEILDVVDGFLVNTVSLNAFSGVWFSPYVNMLSHSPNTYQVIVPEDVWLGRRWSANPMSEEETIVREITGVDIEVTTPAGTFMTTEVTTYLLHDDSFIVTPHSRTYWAEGIGVVKDVQHEGISTNTEDWHSTEEVVRTSMLVDISHGGLSQVITLHYPDPNANPGFYQTEAHFTTNNDLMEVFNNILSRAAQLIFERELAANAVINSVFLNQNTQNLVVDISNELVQTITNFAQEEAQEERIVLAIVDTLGVLYNAAGVTITADGSPFNGNFVAFGPMDFWSIGQSFLNLPPRMPTTEELAKMDIVRDIHQPFMDAMTLFHPNYLMEITAENTNMPIPVAFEHFPEINSIEGVRNQFLTIFTQEFVYEVIDNMILSTNIPFFTEVNGVLHAIVADFPDMWQWAIDGGMQIEIWDEYGFMVTWAENDNVLIFELKDDGWRIDNIDV
ncbi:MAG: GerMN domain-containing protein [Defluviitaleaceae bacterium]|nr:GerMN domain-containing protein [Defluviitaleaceae bacterium]